jgi:hypothetical protein
MKPQKYTAEQICEIINRITTLRMRWLSVVEAQLASRQSSLGLSTDTGSKSSTPRLAYRRGAQFRTAKL